jgi:hypothetical protein
MKCNEFKKKKAYFVKSLHRKYIPNCHGKKKKDFFGGKKKKKIG